MTTATLQNNVRLRIFLVLVLSIGIRVARSFASASVHRATGLLEINYIAYGIVMLCSLLPFKAAWVIAGLVIGCATVLGGAVAVLGTIATVRCLDGGTAGCVQRAPADITALVLTALIVVLDIIQGWSIYLILRFPSFVSSAPQRIRILFCWALPFAWMVNIALLIDSTWTIWVTPHLVIDPTLIILATSEEQWLLAGLVLIAMAADVIAFMYVSLELARIGIGIQFVLASAGLLMLFMPSRPMTQRSTNAPKESDPQDYVQAVAVKETGQAQGLRSRQKSRLDDILF